MYSNVAETFNAYIKSARHPLVTIMANTIRLNSCVMFYFYVYYNIFVFNIFVRCVLYSHACYPSLFLCSINYLYLVYDTIIFQMLICKFKLMNMFVDRCVQSHKSETHLCLEIHNKVEQFVEDNCSL